MPLAPWTGLATEETRGLLQGGVSLCSPGPPGRDARPKVTAENPCLDGYVALVPHPREGVTLISYCRGAWEHGKGPK